MFPDARVIPRSLRAPCEWHGACCEAPALAYTCSCGVCAYRQTTSTKIGIIRIPFDLLCSCSESGCASIDYTNQFATFKQFVTAYH